VDVCALLSFYSVIYVLAGNDIRVVEADAFSVARFWDDRVGRRLAMTSCNLRHVAASALTSLPALRSLRLADNPGLPRTDLVEAVRRVHAVRKLDVSSGAAFRRTFDLVELFYPADSGGIAGLPLEELVAAGNAIRTVSVNITSAAVVATLRSLDLSDNELTTVDGGLLLLRRLERLRANDDLPMRNLVAFTADFSRLKTRSSLCITLSYARIRRPLPIAAASASGTPRCKGKSSDED